MMMHVTDLFGSIELSDNTDGLWHVTKCPDCEALRARVAELEGECERLRGDRRDALRALVYACHSGGMALNEYVPACLLDDAMERERRVDAALEGRD
jgi:hypothetical protein